jgi:hypothetical protein
VIRSIQLVFPFAKPRGAKPDAAQPLAGMLLAAVLAAVLVVADQLIQTWADGHFLLIWVAMWTVVFVALAWVAPVLGRSLRATLAMISQWAGAHAARRADAALWRQAKADARVMGDVQSALDRSEMQA